MSDSGGNGQAMPAILPFEFEKHSVRAIEKAGGEIWFVLSDVCRVLELGNPSQAARRLDEDERGIITSDTPSGEQSLLIINESGLYSLILTSRKPAAKKFKKWVTSEVLPAIRKTGRYEAASSRPSQPEYIPDGPLDLGDLRILSDGARIRDLRLGAALGFALPEDIRGLIHDNAVELKGHAPLLQSENGDVWLTCAQAVLVALFARKAKSPDIRQQLMQVFDRQRRGTGLNPAIEGPGLAGPTCPEGYGFLAGRWVELTGTSFKKGEEVMVIDRGRIGPARLAKDTFCIRGSGRSGEVLVNATHWPAVYHGVTILGRIVAPADLPACGKGGAV